jgi:hypothetical protein
MGAADWTWLYAKVPTKLKELYAEGYSPRKLMRYAIVIFSNQSRISFDATSKLYPQWKQKLQAMAEIVVRWVC